MKIDFLNNIHREPARNDIEFGLCDDQNGEKAYSDITDRSKWVATVQNKNAISVVFTPVDNCLIENADLPCIGRCDGIVTTKKHLFFVEMKDKLADWMPHAKQQLEDTIKLFIKNHPNEFKGFRIKKAFVCNKAKTRFQTIMNEEQKQFYDTYKVRLHIEGNIVIK
ncbi:MAG: hypothetical protein SNH79_01100 [Rikenellaceae bacterium]